MTTTESPLASGPTDAAGVAEASHDDHVSDWVYVKIALVLAVSACGSSDDSSHGSMSGAANGSSTASAARTVAEAMSTTWISET